DYAAIEIKIASEENIQAGISSLRRFRDNMERNNLKLPKYSMVLTSHGNCYRADDNIYIVPINCLKD
ncbi:MAG: AAA family ATPase, partial [bacterium]|nr:AAA family ATPase [bacterium]